MKRIRYLPDITFGELLAFIAAILLVLATLLS